MNDAERSKVRADRAQEYGPPDLSFGSIALCWSGLLSMQLGAPVTVEPRTVSLMLAGLKLMRAAHSGQHADSYVDAHNYVEIAEELAARGLPAARAGLRREADQVTERGWPPDPMRGLAVITEEFLEATRELLQIARDERRGLSPTPARDRARHELVQLGATIESMVAALSPSGADLAEPFAIHGDEDGEA